ncbi:hypothetical protein COBT_001477 [Conglomerata obtusa]
MPKNLDTESNSSSCSFKDTEKIIKTSIAVKLMRSSEKQQIKKFENDLKYETSDVRSNKTTSNPKIIGINDKTKDIAPNSSILEVGDYEKCLIFKKGNERNLVAFDNDHNLFEIHNEKNKQKCKDEEKNNKENTLYDRINKNKIKYNLKNEIALNCNVENIKYETDVKNSLFNDYDNFIKKSSNNCFISESFNQNTTIKQLDLKTCNEKITLENQSGRQNLNINDIEFEEPRNFIKLVKNDTTDINDNIEDRQKHLEMIQNVPLIKFTKSIKRFHFPNHIRKLSEIYTALLTIQRFNEQKKLKSIFIKSKKCIERMISDRIEIRQFEQLFFLFRAAKFHKITILHEGKDVETFTFDFPNCDYDSIFWCYIWHYYCEYLNSNNLTHFGNKFQHGFNVENIIEVPRMKLFENTKIYAEKKQNIAKVMDCKETINTMDNINGNHSLIISKENIKKGKDRTLQILERIKEKERLRKEEFIRNCMENDTLKEIRTKIDYLFLVSESKLIKIENIIKNLKIFKGRENIDLLCMKYKDYQIKNIAGIEYLCKNSCK